MDPLCGEWQSVQESFPSGTGWWLAGRTGRARRCGIDNKGLGGAGGGLRQTRPVTARLRASRLKSVGRQCFAAGVRVKAARPVARFAAGVEGVGSRGHQPGVVGGGKILVEFVVTLFAFLGADVLLRRGRRAATRPAGRACRTRSPPAPAPAPPPPAPDPRARLSACLARMLRVRLIINLCSTGKALRRSSPQRYPGGPPYSKDCGCRGFRHSTPHRH